MIEGVLMSAIVANDLKTKGIKAIEDASQDQLEAQSTICFSASTSQAYVYIGFKTYCIKSDCSRL